MKEETITQLKLGGLQVIQARNGYRFSIDPVLLCSFAQISGKARVADLGTGSGILPLLLNHLGKGSRFLGIEKQPGLSDRARHSVDLNGLQGRIDIVHGDICSLPARLQNCFDAVVSNPPYRKQYTGRVAADDERAEARHETTGQLKDFLHAANFLLKGEGTFSLVYLAERLVELLGEMHQLQLHPKRLRLVHPRAGEPANLVLVEGRKNSRPGLTVEPPLIIYQGRGRDYTAEVLMMYEA
ncbi:MAG: tRNA1(Val) (adenine(37)-N6)-methyltransferase [Desulfuromonadales bacterium]